MSSTPNVEVWTSSAPCTASTGSSAICSERLDRGPKQIRASEANVKHREEELARLREEAKTTRKAVDQKQLQLKTDEQKIKELKSKAQHGGQQPRVPDPQGADRRRRDGQQRAGGRDHRGPRTGRRLPAEDRRGRGGPGRRPETRPTKSTREVEQQQPLIRGDIQRLEAELKQCEADAARSRSATFISAWSASKGEDALAQVVDGCCGGCNQQVPLNVQAEIRMSHPSFCKTCGRLLYLPE